MKDIEISVAGASALFFTLLAFIISTDQLGAQEPGVQIGAAVYDDSSTLTIEFETPIGRNLNFVRHYQRWDDEFPSAEDVGLLNGRDMILSVRALQNNGERILWADIANARPGDPLYQDMVEWANAIRPYGPQIWLSFQHEPEERSNIPNGDAGDFILAWRNFMTVIDSEGVELAGRVWIMTDYAFQLPVADRRHPDRWYPGDEWVEAIAADVFNWHECRTGINNAWTPPRSIIEPIRDFGLKHPTEHMMIAELGSVEDPADPSRKGEWITDVQNLFKDPTYSQFTHVSYFNLHMDEGIFDCDFRVSTSTAATDAFVALADDPFYGGTGIATPFDPPMLDACTAVRDGATVTLNWNFDGRIIRRNGVWLSTEPNGTTTFTDINAPANATYLIRDYSTGSRRDTSCEFATEPDPTPEPPANVCTAARTAASSVTLNWNVDGNIIRRNGSWLTTEPNGTTTFTDTSAPANATYLIRDYSTGSRRDTLCEFTTPTPEPEPPANECVVTFNANGANFVFGVPGTIQLRRNGNWLASASGSYVDSAGTSADTYIARTRNAGTVIDYTCSPG
jgi:hypothetical protein